MTRQERHVITEMYRALEQLPGLIRRDESNLVYRSADERNASAEGADKARVLVYTWLREANMVPVGGR